MMKIPLFHSHEFFIPALMISAAAHVGMIAASGAMSQGAQVTVRQAPSSLELAVIHQPIVTVVDELNTNNKFLDEEVNDTIAFAESVSAPRNVPTELSGSDSAASRGAMTKAAPLQYENMAPEYPRIARQHGWEGTVRLDVLVEKDGSAHDVAVLESSGHSVLDEAALQAVKDWRFTPARSGQTDFSSKIVVPIRFTLIKSGH